MIGDLNDFILPAQACINPFVGLASSQGGNTVKISADVTSDLSQLEYESDKPGANIIKAKTKDNLKVASISLTDCLACRYFVSAFRSALFTPLNLQRLRHLCRSCADSGAKLQKIS